MLYCNNNFIYICDNKKKVKFVVLMKMYFEVIEYNVLMGINLSK
ncbi:hypothetical protein SDC9_182438 [bioreactor metagenome]|uniref:Uncharacterized protein n=1 Tax=bioreactor metagenome TaxID=1076179 RepID=A0A645HFR3_9ZZZZ